MAFLDIVLGLAQRVADELQGCGLVEVFDRENRLENLLETETLALRRRHCPLQKKLVGILLNLDQIGKIYNLPDSSETAAKSQVIGNLIRHACSSVEWSAKSSSSYTQRQTPNTYLISTFAPCSSSFFLIDSASALATPSLTGLGAPSTKSFASLSPSPVSSRTTLMTWIFFSPTSPAITLNSVFSSAAAAGPAAAATATGAAALTPNSSSSSLTRAAASSSVIFLM